MGSQDRRSFSRSGTLNTWALEDNGFDYDLTLYVEKTMVKYRSWQIDGGLGYAESTTSLARNFNQNALGSLTEDLKYIDTYTVSKLIFPISTKLYIKENGKLYVQISALPAIGFRKSVDHSRKSNQRLTKWELALNGLEINPGLGINWSNRVQVALHYRLFHFHEWDEVLLISGRDTTFPMGGVDQYNPFKMWATVAYRLLE